MFCWVGWRPARRSAGSPPGMTLKITNTISEMANSTTTSPTIRRTMNAPISGS